MPSLTPVFRNSEPPLISAIDRAAKCIKDVVHELRPDHYVRSALRRTSYLASGMGTVAASSVAFSLSLTPPLHRFVTSSGEHLELLRNIPFVGNLAHEVLGKAGALGALAVAAPLLGVVATLVESQGYTSDSIHWLATHVALGFAASPVWLLPASQIVGLAPCLLLSLGCLVGVSLVLNERLDAGRATVKMLGAATTCVLAGAPLPSQLAAGVSLAATTTYGALVLSAGACLMAAYLISSSWSALNDESTAEIRATMVKTDFSSDRLNLPGERAPSVFCFDERLLHNVMYLRESVQSRRTLGVQTMLLSGPPGTGKTAISRAVANHLGAVPCIVKPSRILTADNPANEIRKLFEQAQLINQKIVFFFDDAESLFGNRHEASTAHSDRDLRRLITTTLNDCIQGVESSKSPLTLVILSTNDRNHLDESLLSRFAMCDVEVAKPTFSQVRTVFSAIYQQVFKDEQVSLWESIPQVPGQELEDLVVQHFEAAGIRPAGRDLKNLCENALKHLQATRTTTLFFQTSNAMRPNNRSSGAQAVWPEQQSITQSIQHILPQEIARLTRNHERTGHLPEAA